MRTPTPTLTTADLGEALLDCGSADLLWDGHVVGAPGPDRDAAARDVHLWQSRGWRTLTVLDTVYPDAIRAARRPPALLMTDGQLVADECSVAIVGSRRASPAGLAFAVSVARALVDRDVTVVSGLAAGIDTAAMTAATESGGRVVAVIGTGLGHMYPPANAELREQIVQGGGVVLSQFLPGFRGAAWSFPARNKVISAYAEASVIVEASELSGTRHVAAEAVATGRRLLLHRSIADGTTWGRAMVGHPAVFVVSTAADAIEALERIAAADGSMQGRMAWAVANTTW
ncbi:DNA-processing protein DprA [Mycolicibacterium mageritense]|uniref:DNA-processing protein DprA n=1 Tax=Mycolicibacterium mageritense TaxID=53462 RepID=UPI0023EF6B6E|nr:DNA-processing protein DprA [Mycolicibacterium mageritense]